LESCITECMLALIGATPEGKKELVGFQTGVRESAQRRRLKGENQLPKVVQGVMYGRRPRYKRNLTVSEAFGCGHVFGL